LKWLCRVRVKVLSDWKALEVIYGHRQVPSLKVKADGAETLILRRFE